MKKFQGDIVQNVSKNIKYSGSGTQKLEEEINKIFPSAKTIRMDVDTVTKRIHMKIF